MKNLKKVNGFYEALHELYKTDPLWYQHVGDETSPGNYVDDGSLEVSGRLIFKERKQLDKIREMLGITKKTYRSLSQRDAVRLLVTYYRNFGLNNNQISGLLDFSESTLRHDYPPLKPDDKLHPAFVLKLRDRHGRVILK